jgi:hypothetical protein
MSDNIIGGIQVVCYFRDGHPITTSAAPVEIMREEEIKTPITYKGQPLIGEDGEPVLDDEGNPVLDGAPGAPVLDEAGLPTYTVSTRQVATGTWRYPTEHIVAALEAEGIECWVMEAADAVAWREANTVKTPEQLQAEFTALVQARLDNFARTKTYDNMLSLCTYATSANPIFAAEGQYGVEARDSTWAKANAVLGDVLAGKRPAPTWPELEAELPVLAWPVVE